MYNNGRAFSTYDNDHDVNYSGNSAVHCGGANWWGSSCIWNNINGKYGGEGYGGSEFMYWWHFDDNHFIALKSMTLMFREAV